MMMDHTLSFIHRPGRIDISVTKLPQHHVSSPQSISGGEPSTSIDGGAATGGSTAHATAALVNLGVLVNESDSGGGHSRASWGKNDPLKAPIFLHSYCKECKCVVTPVVEISDETWKLSFGKFIEMNFYNHSARCRTGGCAHFLRDDHIMSFVCDGYMAQVRLWIGNQRKYETNEETFYSMISLRDLTHHISQSFLYPISTSLHPNPSLCSSHSLSSCPFTRSAYTHVAKCPFPCRSTVL